MTSKNGCAITIFWCGFGARFAPIKARGRWVRPRRIPQTPVAAEARRKLLKTERLQVFQFDAELPSFRQARDWPKCETLWVFGSTAPGQAARHEDCTGSI